MLPWYSEMHQHRPGAQGGSVSVAYQDSIPLAWCPVCNSPGLKSVYLVRQYQDRIGILLLYHPPSCPTVSLPELVEVLSKVGLKTPRLVVCGGFQHPH